MQAGQHVACRALRSMVARAPAALTLILLGCGAGLPARDSTAPAVRGADAVVEGSAAAQRTRAVGHSASSGPPVLAHEQVYEVAVAARGAELTIDARLPPAPGGALILEEGGGRFVRGLVVVPEAESTARAQSAAPRVIQDASPATTFTGDEVRIAACARGCQLRYRFLLAEAARRLGEHSSALSWGGAFESPPGTWLIRPSEIASGARYRFHVTSPADVSFATGVREVKGAPPHTYGGRADTLPSAPYAVFGTWRLLRAFADGVTFEVAVAVAADVAGMTDREIVGWVADAAGHVAAYLGGFPVARALVIIAPGRGGRIDGMTMGGDGASILLRLGPQVTAASARADWVLTHELVHVASPNVGWHHRWMEEGLATYLEPVARARRGVIDAATFWRDLVRGLPQGLPERGDQGLERSPTWGRTYWGGALFWLLADIRIRERTGGARTLQHVLAALAREGGTVETQWEIARVMQVGDAAATTPVLHQLYEELAQAPGTVDLQRLWQQLGVELRGERLLFDENAPRAELRRRITAAP